MKHTAILRTTLLCAALASPALAAPSREPTPLNQVPRDSKIVSTPSGLQYVDVVVGKGEAPKPGDICIVHYMAWTEDGKEIGNSRSPRPVDPRDPSKGTKALPFGFKLGSGQVIPGWDEGVATMREGGTRLLYIPPQLGYGSKGGQGGLVPPDARLTFRVELLKTKPDPNAPVEPPLRAP